MKFYCLQFTILALLCTVQQVCTAQDYAGQSATGQDSTRKGLLNIPSRYFTKVSKQTTVISNRIDKKTEKLLRRLQRQESKLNRMVSKIDSLNAKAFFADAQQKYEQISNKLTQKASGITGRVGGEYLAYFDSLKGSLSFLQGNKNLLSAVKSEKLDHALNEVKQFQSKLQQADMIKQFIRERKQQIRDMLSRYTVLPKNITKAFGRYEKDAFYYAAQIRNYKETFRDPDKLQRTALTLLNKIPAFQQFMKEHSELAGLFNLPGGYGSPAGLIGLQTRDQVQQIITTQMGGSPNAGQLFGQQIQAAQTQLGQFKEKLTALGGGSGDIDMPDFKPRMQKTKTFLQRIEYGTNIQSTRSSYFFPSVTDLGFSIGYRIDDKNIAGIGIAGKIGWGKDIRHIAVTGQGISFRSFIDIKLKGSFFASAGFEYNFQKPFNEIQQLYNIEKWQRSGLAGVSKIISIKSKVFKKTKISILWDYLSYQQRPRVSQPIKFRVGYNF